MDIHKLKDQSKEKILEAEKYCSNACFDIFKDDSRGKMITIEVVFEYFYKNFKNLLMMMILDKHSRLKKHY